MNNSLNVADCEPSDFAYFRRLVHERTGIHLDQSKNYLIDARLSSIARREDFATVDSLLARLRSQSWNDIHQNCIEAMATSETSFFRDVHPFQQLRNEIIPNLMVRRSNARRLRIWSAGCATGQEPYSIALLLRDSFPSLAGWIVEILASDLSQVALERARAGRYSQVEVNRGLPARLLVDHFQKRGATWTICDSIRRMVEYRRINLVKSLPIMASMDVIFLRNVLIYFDDEERKRTLERIWGALKPDGYLILGSVESVPALDRLFEPVRLREIVCYHPRNR